MPWLNGWSAHRLREQRNGEDESENEFRHRADSVFGFPPKATSPICGVQAILLPLRERFYATCVATSILQPLSHFISFAGDT